MPETNAGTSANAFLTTARGFAVASVVVVIVLFVTAGELVQLHELKDVHGGAAIALHVVTAGLTAALAGLAFYRRRGWWTVVVAGIAFVYSFIQAALGEGDTLKFHIPGALLIVGTIVWVTAWVFSSAASDR
ncbi:hypothetical protein FK535_24605 [Mycolicibacterium sp. 018/SC-01/001]|uniref:hypothetical protein n=1 Tax=Mycolicibacterium sp. 018/SC-01/001 TaxID=2592069 RepID=UPI00117F6B0B|nr:hypothetical protein [Mycolicibacterium sp. 018/SC-01/001]TRW78546.1 hypothetical protein FK535_24605 [Mycolicibacterium sp. 018/SC-01/001]